MSVFLHLLYRYRYPCPVLSRSIWKTPEGFVVASCKYDIWIFELSPIVGNW